jgi:hypothetical protein
MVIFFALSLMVIKVRLCVLSLAAVFVFPDALSSSPIPSAPCFAQPTRPPSLSCSLFLQPWANAEVRAYRFASPDDNDAEVVPIKEVTKEGGDDPTSSEMK